MYAQMWRIHSHFPGHKGMISPTLVAGGHRAQERVNATTSSCQWRPSAAPEQMEAEAAEDTLLLPRLKAPWLIGTRVWRWGNLCRQGQKAKRACVEEAAPDGQIQQRGLQSRTTNTGCGGTFLRGHFRHSNNRKKIVRHQVLAHHPGKVCSSSPCDRSEMVMNVKRWKRCCRGDWTVGRKREEIRKFLSMHHVRRMKTVGNNLGSWILHTEETTAQCRKRSERTRVVSSWVSCEV